MAPTKPKPPVGKFVIVDEKYLLPEADAAAMLAILLRAERVDWDWNKKNWKYSYVKQDDRQYNSIKALPIGNDTLVLLELDRQERLEAE